MHSLLAMLVAQFLAPLGLQQPCSTWGTFMSCMEAGQVLPLYSLRCLSMIQRSFCFWLSPQKVGRVTLCHSTICRSAGAPGWWRGGIGKEDRNSRCSARAAMGSASSASPWSFCQEHLISSMLPERAFSSQHLGFGSCCRWWFNWR